MAQICLLSLPSLDNTYQNVIDFGSIGSQRSWFQNKVGLTVEGNIKTDTEQEQIVLNTSYGSIRNFDYLYFQDSNGKYLYYFIINKAIKTPDTCIVTIECDVWSTYYFDFKLMDSFVERCHVPRWNGEIPTMELTDEGLAFGDNVYSSYENITYLQNNFLITSTVPLGQVKSGGWIPPGGGGGGGLVTQAIPSAKGYRFIKGYEGFGPYPYRVIGEVADTAGYGIREDYQSQYFELLKPFPCSEMLASSVYGTMMIKNFSEPVYNRMKQDGFEMDKVPQKHFDVWCSHAMNAGLGGWSSGTPYRLYSEGAAPEVVANAIKNWAISGEGGTILPGLVARRNAEADIFLEEKYEMRKIAILNQSGGIDGYVTDNDGNGFIPPEFGEL